MQRVLACVGSLASPIASQAKESRRYLSTIPFTAPSEPRQALTNVKFTPVAPFLLIPRVIIYDGVCHLCNAGVKWVIDKDKDECISFCSVQSKAAEPYLIACGVGREDVLRRFIFVEGPGVCSSGSSAALRVASYLPFPYSALSSFLVIPAPLRDAAYDYVAKHRYRWFGRSDKCIVPSDEVLHRFVDRDELMELRENQDIDDHQSTG
ncbi:uncharacterized protein LOC9637324 [Selaginella moellendorffii]|uniref:uncharacterized protein LOC9637324 n=1 Tax=Selaginella moellendorffii TaxID=88036 RepID=UPI000D1C7B9B|nr:uncharacterized protein LOC9637324 [Selaginella moellendorffii]|eukprot:XP_024533364.1 uncharacterized protein LOC9637324 [Selaginella moellendorffii]